MGFCHCRSCRSWSAGPVNAFTLWKPENVKVTKGADLIANPELLATPPLAARSAAWWWRNHGCNQFADKEQFVLLTRRINGGVNGLDDRQQLYEAAKEVLL
jgi:putative chitinase